jgi:hypothetical protein
LGKSRHTKWYDKNSNDDYYDSRSQAENFKNRRAKRLRTITTKHEDDLDRDRREEMEYD